MITAIKTPITAIMYMVYRWYLPFYRRHHIPITYETVEN